MPLQAGGGEDDAAALAYYASENVPIAAPIRNRKARILSAVRLLARVEMAEGSVAVSAIAVLSASMLLDTLVVGSLWAVLPSILRSTEQPAAYGRMLGAASLLGALANAALDTSWLQSRDARVPPLMAALQASKIHPFRLAPPPKPHPRRGLQAFGRCSVPPKNAPWRSPPSTI